MIFNQNFVLSIKGLEEHCRRLGEEELISLSSGEKKEMRNTLKVSELLRQCENVY